MSITKKPRSFPSSKSPTRTAASDVDRFALLSEQTGQLVYDYDVLSGQIEWYGAIKELTGFTATEFRATNVERWASLIHPEDRDDALRQLDRVMKSGGQYHVQYRFLTKSNVYRYFEDRGAVLLQDGKAHRMIGTMSDSTPQVEAESALRQSERMFRSVVEGLPVGLVLFDREGRIRHCNAFILSMLRVKESDLIGMSFREIPWKVIRDDGSEIAVDELPVAVAIETGRPQRDVVVGLRGIRKRTIWLLTQVEPHFDIPEGPGLILCAVSDVSSLRETRHALARSRERLGELSQLHREILQSAAEGIVVYDRDLRYRLWNRSMEELTGLRSQEVIGRKATDIFPHLEAYGLVERIKKAMEGEGSVSPDFLYESPRGTRHWISSTYSPHRDVSGEVVGTIAMVRDVTTRHAAEEAFKESQRLMTTIAESTPDFLYVYNLSTKSLTYSNRSLAEYLGFSVEDRRVPQIHASDRWDKLPAIETVTAENRFEDVDGRPRWFVSRERIFLATPEGRPVQIIGSMREITEQKEKEMALQESESHYRSIFESTTDGLLIVDRLGKIRDANASACGMHGYTFNEIRGQRIEKLFHAPQENFLDQFFSKAERGLSLVSEGTNVRKDGSVFFVEMRGTRFQSKDQSRFLVVVTDISERKHAEQKIIQAHKMESIGRIAGGVAHDINNILAVILPTAQMIRSEQQAGDRVREFADVIINSAQRSAEIVKQLLVYSRQTPTRKSWLNINDTVGEVLKMLNRLLEKNINIETDMEEHLPFVEADTTQMHQVLLNLAVNARDAMPAGGMLRIETRSVKANGELCRRLDLMPGEYVKVSVQDSGTGINPSDLTKIFEAFYSSKQAGYGTGLGLAVVRSIVLGHKGAVDVTSRLNEGSRFDVYIPAAKRQPPGLSSAEKASMPKGTGRILMVDDEVSILAMCKDVLERLGYQVDVASNGEDAIRQFVANDFNLVILDIQMPGMDGVDVLETVLGIKPDVRYLFMTGYIKPERLDYLEKTYRPLILQKPFTMEELADHIHRLLKKD